tara:strand:- start:394 stop:516 length:123 start_codon:yes stop_codon:yes gene_type:complete
MVVGDEPMEQSGKRATRIQKKTGIRKRKGFIAPSTVGGSG